MRKILCPVDFSEPSRTALCAAARFARQFKGSLHVLFVQHPLLASAAAGAEPAPPSLGVELKRFIAETADLDLPVEPVLHVVSGEPAEEIRRLTEREHIAAIVMGMHGLTGMDKAFFGSTTARVLRRATTPLVVVPVAMCVDKARDLAGLGSILVLTDFGPAARCAASTAARFATTVGARLVLVHVLPPISAPASWQAYVDAAMEQRRAEAHRCMCEAMVPLELLGPVESVIVEGNIAESIADLARTHHAGLIVLGLEGDAREARPGSTAYAVICGAPVPVVAVPVPVVDAEVDATDAAA